jgi:hypothetical protein
MKLKAATIALIFMAGMLIISTGKVKSAKSSDPAEPKLAIASFEHSFGTVVAGKPLNHTFKVKNEGTATLEIKNVSPSCGCTTTNYDKAISPGQTGGITLAIEKTENYRGEVIKTAEVTTNDPNQPKFTLTLRANFTDK